MVPTAFHDDGTLDRDGIGALVEAYGTAGADAFLVLGFAGEGHLLDHDERRVVIDVATGAASGVPLLVGLGRPDGDQLRAAHQAAGGGAEAVVAAIAAGDTSHRRAQLESLNAAGLPVVVQHHPAATGIRATNDEVVALLDSTSIVGLKAEAPPTPDLVAAVVAAGGPPVLGGLSALYLLEELEAGAAGTMTGIAAPEHLARVVRRWRDGEHAAAADEYVQLCAYLRLEAAPGSVGIVTRTEAWRQRGVISSSRVREGQPLGVATKVAITRRLQSLGIATPHGVVVG